MFALRFLLFLFPISSLALELSLHDVERRVRMYHPALRAARLTVEEAKGRVLGSGRLANPQLSASFQNESKASPRTLSAGIDQAFPLTQRLVLERELGQQLISAAELEVSEVERLLVAEASSLTVRMLALDRQASLRQEQIKLAQELSVFAKSRAEKGELSPLDAAQLHLDAQRFSLEAKKLTGERSGLLAMLKPLLGLSPKDTLTLRGDLPALILPNTQSWRQRADYQLALAREKAAQTDIALAEAKRSPDLTAGVFAAQERQQGVDTGHVGIRFSLPLPFWNKNEGEIAEKTAAAERLRLETSALGSQIAGEADAARSEMQAQAALAKEMRGVLLPLAVEQAHNLDEAYQKGQGDLLSVLRAREQRLQLEASALDAERDFHLARIRFESAIGAK